jgi:hypothetical protein
MKKIFTHSFIIAAVVLMFSNFGFAQKEKSVSSTSQLYVISAKAGGVNFIEGKVSIARKSGKSGYLLKGDTVEIGDKISTGADGRAEILLNPGSFVRLAPNSEFEFLTTSLDDLRLKLSKGSAILEVYADKDYTVMINTPDSQYVAVKSGVYRVDILADNSSKLEVWSGKAQVNNQEVKGGRTATVNRGQTTVVKFDRDEKDELETWSRTRSKELTKLNERLERRALRNTLINGFYSNSWNMYNSFGLWIYDTSISGYCFFPFGYGWRSPYGFGYGWNAWNIRLPYWVYYQPINPVVNNSGGNNNANNTDRRRNNPPFQTIQNDVGTSPTDSRNPQNNDSFPTVRQPQPIIIIPSNPTGSRTRGN